MESDSSDAEGLPDLESLDDFLASSFDADIIVDDKDEVEGQENADSLELEPYCFEPFVEGAKHEDSDSESNAEKRHFYHAALLALWKAWLYDSMLPGDWPSEDSLMWQLHAALACQMWVIDLHAPNSKSANFSANTVFWVRRIMMKIVPYYMKNLLQGSVEGCFTCPLRLELS